MLPARALLGYTSSKILGLATSCHVIVLHLPSDEVAGKFEALTQLNSSAALAAPGTCKLIFLEGCSTTNTGDLAPHLEVAGSSDRPLRVLGGWDRWQEAFSALNGRHASSKWLEAAERTGRGWGKCSTAGQGVGSCGWPCGAPAGRANPIWATINKHGPTSCKVNRRSEAPATLGGFRRLRTANGPQPSRTHSNSHALIGFFVTQLLSPPTSAWSGNSSSNAYLRPPRSSKPVSDLLFLPHLGSRRDHSQATTHPLQALHFLSLVGIRLK